MMSRAVMVIAVEMSRRGAFGRPFSSSSRIHTARTPELVEGRAAEEFGQHDGGAIADDLSLTIELPSGRGRTTMEENDRPAAGARMWRRGSKPVNL
jgi:hypothetical protein